MKFLHLSIQFSEFFFFLVNLTSCATSAISQFWDIFMSSVRSVMPITSNPLAHTLLSVSVTDLPFLDVSYQWTHTAVVSRGWLLSRA